MNIKTILISQDIRERIKRRKILFNIVNKKKIPEELVKLIFSFVGYDLNGEHLSSDQEIILKFKFLSE